MAISSRSSYVCNRAKWITIVVHNNILYNANYIKFQYPRFCTNIASMATNYKLLVSRPGEIIKSMQAGGYYYYYYLDYIIVVLYKPQAKQMKPSKALWIYQTNQYFYWVGPFQVILALIQQYFTWFIINHVAIINHLPMPGPSAMTTQVPNDMAP